MAHPCWLTIRNSAADSWKFSSTGSPDLPDSKTSPGPRLLEAAERYIYLGAGAILVLAAVALLIAAVVEMVEFAMQDSTMRAVVHLLDRVLLALMLAEVIYTVTSISRTRRLDVQPFLIIGVIAAVRRILVITAESTSNVDLSDPHFQAVLAELALLGAIILSLAVALRILQGVDFH